MSTRNAYNYIAIREPTSKHILVYSEYKGRGKRKSQMYYITYSLVCEKKKDDNISKKFYYLGHMRASGKVREFVMPNTDKTAVEIEWLLDNPVREALYEYIVNE